MKAAFIESLNQPLVLKETEIPVPGEKEVLIRLKAAALNHRDLWIQKGMYAGIKLPVIPGSDGAGIAENGSFKGQPVIINPGMNWGKNQYAQAKDYLILGMPVNGTFAQYVKVPEHLVYPKPTHLSFHEAAALPLGGLTAYRAAMVRGAAQKGEKILVTGIGGGVALWSAIFAIALGCEVWVTSGHEEKINHAIQIGCSGGFNYRQENWIKETQNRVGAFDLVIDGAGGPTFGKLMDLTRPGGRIAIYGATLGELGGMMPSKLFWKQISILGTTMGSDNDFKEMVDFVHQHQLKMPLRDFFHLDRVNEAVGLMENGEQLGKVILDIP